MKVLLFSGNRRNLYDKIVKQIVLHEEPLGDFSEDKVDNFIKENFIDCEVELPPTL